MSSPAIAASGGSNTKKGHSIHPNKPQSSGDTGGGHAIPFKTMELAPTACSKKRKVSPSWRRRYRRKWQPFCQKVHFIAGFIGSQGR